MWEMGDSGHETLFSDDAGDTPPRITGTLTKGKIVLRPVAFKPVSMTSSRFSNHGERYGSTPVLARPSSHLTLYGSSSDLRHHGSASHCSLDRKGMSPSPLALSSLPVTCGRYDSLDSVPSHARAQHISRLLTSEGSGSVADMTPSPCEMAELEAALRERDSEVAYLRQTMEHNEQVIFRVYQEKERVWEREMRRTKTLHENRLRAAAQKSHKLEQMLMMQTYQLQQDKKRLREDLERTERENSELRQEVELLRSRLEDTEWGLCQKSGELALLKSQLKETQGEQANKGHEVLSLKNEVKELRLELEDKNKDIASLRITSDSQKQHQAEVDKLNIQIEDLRGKLNLRSRIDSAKDDKTCESNDEITALREEVSLLSDRLQREQSEWEREKEKVLSYQRQLQLNYVQMYRRTRTLEGQLQNLTTSRTKVPSLNAIQL